MPGRILRFGPFRLDEAAGTLRRQDADGTTHTVPLAPRSLALLAYFAAHPGRLVAKEEALAAVWADAHVADGALKVRVRELRAALGDDADAPRILETVHRRGYRFIAPVQVDDRPAGDLEPHRDPDARSHPDAPVGRSVAQRPGTREVPDGATPPGRDTEMASLRELLARALEGHHRLVFVSGEPGIGKTALVEALADSASAAGVVVGRGRAVEHHGVGEAYLPFLGALTDLVRGSRDVATRVRAVLAERAPSWLRQLPAVDPGTASGSRPEPDGGGIATTGNPALEYTDAHGMTRERMLRELAEALVVLTQSEPLVLVLEDLHWSDPSTLDLLAVLARRRERARLLVLVTYRPVDVILSGHPLRSLKRLLEEQRLCSEIVVPYLDEGTVAQIVAQRMGVTRTSPALAAAIFDRSAGNPLFVANLVDHLRDRGRLVVRDGEAAMQVPEARLHDEVPEGLRPMIDRQLAGLPAGDAVLLEIASVVGEEFPAAVVAALADLPLARVEDALDERARRHRLLRLVSAGRGDKGAIFAFTHSLYRTALYRRLDEERSAALHRGVGQWLESRGATPGELARHFSAAGEVVKALHYACAAAERARSLLAFAEAAGHYETAMALAETSVGRAEVLPATACELEVARAECLQRAGRVGEASEAFQAASDRARQLGLPTSFARAVLGLGRAFQLTGRSDPRLIELLDEALTWLPATDDPLRAQVMARLDAALSPLPSAFARRADLARDALAMARRLGDIECSSLVLQYTRWGFIGRESAAELRDSADEIERWVAAAPGAEQALHLQLLRLAQLAELGDPAAGGAGLVAFETAARAAGIPWFEWFALRLRAMHALQAGRFEDAERDAELAADLGLRFGHPNAMPVRRVQRMVGRMLQGRLDEVTVGLERLLQTQPDRAALGASLAHAYAWQGNRDAARAQLRRLTVDRVATIPRDTLWLMFLAHASEACATSGDAPTAEFLWELSPALEQRVVGVGPSLASLGHGSRHRALLAGVLGREDEARALLERARAAHEAAGALPWLAITLRDLARAALRRSPGGAARARARREAREFAARAREIAAGLGMAGIEREAAALEAEVAR